MTTIGSNTLASDISVSLNTGFSVITSITNNPVGITMGNDKASFTAYASAPPATTSALPTEAGGWKRFTNSMGEMFSNIADKMGFGETYKIGSEEFNQVDTSRDGNLNRVEFNLATLNLLDIMGTEFARADKNQDGRVGVHEYVDYRKQQIGNAFNAKDSNNDKHLSINEVGVIGQQLLNNRDPRFDPSQDGLVNKREFIRANLRGAISIRDFLGL